MSNYIRPTVEDARVFAEVYTVFASQRVYDAFVWYYSVFGYGGGSPDSFDYDAFLKQNPRGSDGYKQWTTIASFFETLGVLVRHEALNEALVLDRFPVDWYWRYLSPLVQNDREQGMRCDTAWFADSFEHLAERSRKWQEDGRGQAKWVSGAGRERKKPGQPI